MVRVLVQNQLVGVLAHILLHFLADGIRNSFGSISVRANIPPWVTSVGICNSVKPQSPATSCTHPGEERPRCSRRCRGGRAGCGQAWWGSSLRQSQPLAAVRAFDKGANGPGAHHGHSCLFGANRGNGLVPGQAGVVGVDIGLQRGKLL